MHIKGLLKFISEELSLLLLLEQLFLELEDLSAEVRDARCLVLSDNQLSLNVSDLLLGADDLSDLLLVVDLTLVQSGLLDLDLLIKDLKFFVTLDKLSTQDVTLIDDHLVVFLLLLLLLLSLGNDEFETRYVTFLGLDHVIARGDLLLNLLNVSIESSVLILILLLLRFLSGNSGILGLDLLLELRDLLSHSLELHLELCDLLGGLEKVLRVEVTVRTHGLIEVLLLLQSALSLNVLLLKLGDQVVFELDLLKALIVLGISLRCLNTIFLLVLFELID